MEEPQPLGEELSDIILNILDPAIFETYRQYQAEYRRIIANHERHFRQEEKRARKKGTERVQVVKDVELVTQREDYEQQLRLAKFDKRESGTGNTLPPTANTKSTE